MGVSTKYNDRREDTKMYSIDKVKAIVYGVKNEIIQLMLDKLSAIIDKELMYYESKGVSKCYRNFTYKGIYLGIENNWNKIYSRNTKNVVLEWNPNKVKLDKFPIDLRILFEDLNKVEVMCFDVAIDVPIALENLIVLKQHELQRMNILSHSKIETYYIGKFNENGFCRIYDKAKESKLDHDLTRIEIHLKNVGLYGYYNSIKKLKLPNILIFDESNLNDISDTNKVLVQACYKMPQLLSILEKRKRKQIKDLIKNNLKQIDISIENIMQTCLNFKFIE